MSDFRIERIQRNDVDDICSTSIVGAVLPFTLVDSVIPAFLMMIVANIISMTAKNVSRNDPAKGFDICCIGA